MTWSIRDRSRTTDPASACAPPHTPEPPPRGITAVDVSDAQARTVATSSVLAGKTTAAGTGSSSPRTRLSSASAQESMARSRRISASVRTVPSGRRLTSMSRGLTRRIVTHEADQGIGQDCGKLRGGPALTMTAKRASRRAWAPYPAGGAAQSLPEPEKIRRKNRKTFRTSRKMDAARKGAEAMSLERRSRWKSNMVKPAKITRPSTE